VESKPIEMYEIELIESAISPEERRKFRLILSPKLKELFGKLELFSYKIKQAEGYLEYNILPPPLLIGNLISLSNSLLDDLTFIIRNRVKPSEVKEFEKSMENLKKRLKELEENLVKITISEKTKVRDLSIYVELCTSLVNDYLKQVFIDFKESLSLMSDVWAPMEKKFAEIAIKRMGIVPVKEEEEKGEKV